MSRHPIEELIARWRGEQLTPEQMIGQILLTLRDLEQRQGAVERRMPLLDRLEGLHERLGAALAPAPPAPPKDVAKPPKAAKPRRPS